MILYHFTTREAVASIMEEGLNRGEAPISETRVAKAVNLTTDPRPDGHGLDKGGHVVTPEESALYRLKMGWDVPAGTVFTNKREVRLTVKVPSTDRNLKRWQQWSRKHCEPGFAAQLERAAGDGGRKAKTWWLYFGTVPPSAIVAIEDLQPEG